MLKEIFAVSHYPALDDSQPFKTKLILLLKVYGILFLVMFLSAPLLALADHVVTHVFHYKSVNTEYQKTMKDLIHRMGYVKAIAYICLLGPLLEEIVFRLGLSLKKQHVAIALGCVLFFFIGIVPGFKALNGWLNIGIRLSLLIVGYLVIVSVLPDNISLTNRTHTRIIICSMLVFGLVHITNYMPLHWAIIFIYPVFVIPQLLMGWCLTYMRFKNGFFWGVALHIMINSFATLMHNIK